MEPGTLSPQQSTQRGSHQPRHIQEQRSPFPVRMQPVSCYSQLRACPGATVPGRGHSVHRWMHQVQSCAAHQSTTHPQDGTATTDPCQVATTRGWEALPGTLGACGHHLGAVQHGTAILAGGSPSGCYGEERLPDSTQPTPMTPDGSPTTVVALI